MKQINEVITKTNRPVKVLQFGEGNFLRAFVDWMIDIANEKTDFNGNIALVQPLEKGMTDMLNKQDCLYTTVLRGKQAGEIVSEKRAITSIEECINPYADFAHYMEYSKNPDLRFVVSNTTEAGISWSDNTSITDAPPASFPAKVTQFLYERFRFFKGDISKGLVFIPCELIDKNGDVLKDFVLKHAKEWSVEQEFANWIQDACYFCNSLVDRIVPGYPAQEAESLCKEIGYNDSLLDAAEIFHLWVIESEKDFSNEFPLSQAGLNVIWTEDMSFYRTRKVRILNGAHTMFVPTAYLLGLETVEESLKHPQISTFIKKGLFEEIIPSMEGDQKELDAYAKDVLERFENPFIRHLLISITLNSISKFKTRDLPSLIDYINRFEKIPTALAFSMAALFYFYLTTDVAQDDQAILDFFANLKKEYPAITKENSFVLTETVLSKELWWGQNLAQISNLTETISGYLASIAQVGIASALATILD